MNTLRRLLLAVLTCMLAPAALGAADGSGLEIPRGADVAIVVFEDLQCPDCRRAHPELLAAAKSSDVPIVIHDFPIKRHAWAFPAAILARHFTLQSPELGVEFRTFIFANQPDITPDNLREQSERFAAQHQQRLPAVVDPDGKLLGLVQADYDLGVKIGLEYVPLIFVVSRDTGPSRWTEVTDTQKLGEVIADFRKKLANH
jgi:protein-disulfide isomerase